ncbi:hypothetical protein LPJ66_000142 [Kickxella alabastrina]|uniref:Uncharacterized protein n=1 Tax=Kickxella alabastrina TaxID=61397 RepID=A0ACC1IX37_9FUNG|nr:hypothetical protein LPJ66_000142 [Kickxella alabastrina]
MPAVPALDMSQLYQFSDMSSLGLSPTSAEQLFDISKGNSIHQEFPGQNESIDQNNQFLKDWVQSFISQAPMPQFADMHQHHGNHPDFKSAGDPANGLTTSSDSDSDDISKSLSFLLTQQLAQNNQSNMHAQQFAQQQSMDSSSKKFSGIRIIPQNGDYNTVLSDILENAYDGGRRVISMPNPLGSLSLDIPINAPMQSMVGMEILANSQRMISKDMMYGGATHQQNAFVAAAAAASARLSTSKSIGGMLGFHNDLCSLSADEQMVSGASASGNSQCGFDIAEGNSGHLTALGISGTERRQVSGPNAAMYTTGAGIKSKPPNAPFPIKAKRGRPPLAGKRSASSSGIVKIHERLGTCPATPESTLSLNLQFTSAMAATGICNSGAQSPRFDHATGFNDVCGTSSHSTATPTSASSALIPHRVDRQLAAAARPLLFVRPRDKGEQPRRRKRRCVSTNTTISSGFTTDTMLGSTETIEDQAMSKALALGGEDGQNNLQWQRVSEQRRRDAMRENFDLLKRMLPQAYMASDDGRELARPVLLARFLRWVDDTLIEMASLKAEVTRLRVDTQSPGMAADMWPDNTPRAFSAPAVIDAAPVTADSADYQTSAFAQPSDGPDNQGSA